MALIAGIQAPPDRIMGHAGAFVGPGEKTAMQKVRALQDVGVATVYHPSKFGDGMKQLLNRSNLQGSPPSYAATQRRSMHTSRRPTLKSKLATMNSQRRSIHIPEPQSFQMLKDRGVSIAEDTNPDSRDYFLTVIIDRTNYAPCIITSYSIGGESSQHHAKTYLLGLNRLVNPDTLHSIAADLKCQERYLESLKSILSALIYIFFEREAYSLSTRISRDGQSSLAVARCMFEFDDAAYRSGKRHKDIQDMRDARSEVPEEVEAEKDGIVYIK